MFTRKRTPTFKWDDSFEIVNYKTLDFRIAHEYIFTCPDDIYLEFLAFTAATHHAAGVATRATWMDILDGSETLFISSVYSLAGGGAHQFHFADHAQQARSSSGLERLFIPMPKPAFLLPGWRLRFQTTGFLTFDEIRWTNLVVKKWYIR